MLNNKDFLLRLWRLFQENLHLLVTQTYMYLILNENEKQNKTKQIQHHNCLTGKRTRII